MARAFSAKDARQLIQQHQKLRNQLIDNYNYAERQKKVSNSIASSLFSRNVFAKLLEDELLSGNIRSLDSQDVQRLLCSLNKYIKGKSLSEDSETLARDTRTKYNQEINNLKPATNAVTWLLTFGKSRAAAEAAYAYLQKEADGTYAWQVQSVAKDIEQLEQSDAAQAVQQFEQNRTSFRDTLYEINSNIFMIERYSLILSGYISSTTICKSSFAGLIRLLSKRRKQSKRQLNGCKRSTCSTYSKMCRLTN